MRYRKRIPATELSDQDVFNIFKVSSTNLGFVEEARVLAMMKMVDIFLKNLNQQMNANEAAEILTPIFTEHPDKRIQDQAAALLTKLYMLPS
jgi:hypothetical protein